MNKQITCSFCNKTTPEDGAPNLIITHNDVAICSECVYTCMHIIFEKFNLISAGTRVENTAEGDA